MLKKENDIKFIYFYTTKLLIKASCLYKYNHFQAYRYLLLIKTRCIVKLSFNIIIITSIKEDIC